MSMAVSSGGVDTPPTPAVEVERALFEIPLSLAAAVELDGLLPGEVGGLTPFVGVEVTLLRAWLEVVLSCCGIMTAAFPYFC